VFLVSDYSTRDNMDKISLRKLLKEVGEIEGDFREKVYMMVRKIATYCKIAEVDEGYLLALKQSCLNAFNEWGTVYEYCWREGSLAVTPDYVADLQMRWKTAQEAYLAAITPEYEKACRIWGANLAEAIRATAALNLGRK
jgi:hypothetical protein